MVNLYFIRHGESEGNAGNFIGGTTDWKLTDKGVSQAKAAGQDTKNQGKAIDVVVSSPLQRAHNTAKEVASALDYDHEDIVIMPEIKERHFGVLEGKGHDAFGVGAERYFAEPACVDHIEDIETIRELHERAEQALKTLQKRPEETIVIVSHAAFGRSLRKAIEGIPHDHPTEDFENAKLIKLI